MGFLSKIFKSAGKQEEQPDSVSYLNPYSTLGELDFHLINEGRHEKLWEALGAHVLRDKDGALLGTAFSVWAPNAQAISLIGDHNHWDKSAHPMVRQGASGIWEIFIPEIGAGTKYKFAICGAFG
jgi:1,4-alpha-glucan branching enzyme